MRVGWVFSAIFDHYVVISRKRCILDTKLLWDGNRKPYAGYRMMSLSMTLSDPSPTFQGHGSFKRRVSPKRRILQTRYYIGRTRTPQGRYRQATQLYSLQPHCSYVNRANFSQASRGFVSDSWAFLFRIRTHCAVKQTYTEVYYLVQTFLCLPSLIILCQGTCQRLFFFNPLCPVRCSVLFYSIHFHCFICSE